MEIDNNLKQKVKKFWNRESCGEVYALGNSEHEFYEAASKARYDLEPYIAEFARFQDGKGKDVLEIGVGMGADHLQWALSSPSSLTGIDLTPRAIEHTTKRLALFNVHSDLMEADAEHLPFSGDSFDIVYSWGGTASLTRYTKDHKRGLPRPPAWRNSQNHDLPHILTDWIHALDSLWSP